MATPGSEDQSEEVRLRKLAAAELRHRLADSFQLVTSLIRLRLRRTDTPESRADLSWLLDIVTALGLLEQRLATADTGAFAGYLADVGAFWRRIGGDQCRILVEAERFRVAEQRASTLALIAHELIRDAVERAADTPLLLEIRLRRRGEGRGELLIVERGEGPPRTRDLWLASELIQQLGGTLTAEPGRVRLEFAAEPPPPPVN